MADTIEANVEQLKKNDVLRRELVANISHDLRSPLASIQAYFWQFHKSLKLIRLACKGCVISNVISMAFR